MSLSMSEGLLQQGIRLKSHSIGAHKTTCPRCSHMRKDKKDPCLWVNIKEADLAMWKCHNCFWTGSAGDVSRDARHEPSKPREYKKPDATVPAVPDFPAKMLEYIRGRGITDEVIKRNKLYADGQSICFPYHVRGALTNVKYRTVDKKFRLSAGAQLTFYGYDDCVGQDDIIIVEGEFDKLALEVCGLTNVLSVPNGAPARIKDGDIDNTGAFEYLQHAEDMMKAAKRVIIAVDNDAAGKNLQYELCRRIGLEKTWLVDWPTKDANDCLLQLGIDVTLDCINDARPHPIKGLYTVDQVTHQLSEYYSVGMKAGSPTGWANVDELYTVMPAELTVVTGVPNSGKSEWMDALLMNLARNEGKKFVIFSPEHKIEAHIAKLIEKVVELPSSPKADNRMTHEQFMDGAAWVNKHFVFIVADDDENLPNLDWALQIASQAVFRHGCHGFLLDPWNEIEHDYKSDGKETDYVGRALARVKRWMRKHNCATWIVAHPTKIHADKDGKTRVASLYDIAGSSNWANKVDNGIVIHRSGSAKYTTEVWVKKIRDKHVGKRGVCELRYNISTGTYTVPDTMTSKARSYAEESSEEEEHHYQT